MATRERVTVTLPSELVDGIDRFERNRSRFIAEAVAHELERRRHEGLKRSLESPHPETGDLVDTGLGEWGASLPAGDTALVDLAAGTAVRWVSGRGWEAE